MGTVHQLILGKGVEEARRSASHDKTERLCVEAAYEVMSDERSQIGIVHAGFAMAALPHKKTTESVWQRQGGQITLLVESGLDSAKRPIGVPYGSIARMIVLYLQTQAVKTRSREVELGGSMNAWLNTMGITVGGKTYRLVREQSRRISRCRLTFFRRIANAELVTNGAFVRDAILPLDPEFGNSASIVAGASATRRRLLSIVNRAPSSSARSCHSPDFKPLHGDRSLCLARVQAPYFISSRRSWLACTTAAIWRGLQRASVLPA